MLTRPRDSLFAALGGRFFYGWAILAVAGLGIFASGPGQSHSFSVFVGPIADDLGLSSAAVASAYGVATLAAALCLPLVGRMVDRRGPRAMMLVIVLLLGLACALFGGVTSLIWLSLGFGALRFLGQGSLMLASANLVAQWFQRRRGFAMSLMALGFGASMAIHPPLAQALVDWLGWRQAWVVLGLLTWLIMLPPVLLILHDRPEDCGLHPDGEAPGGIPGDTAGATSLDGLSLRQATATSTFYILALGWFAIAMLVTTLHFYQVTLLTGQGVSAELAARAFPISAVTMMLSMPLVGRLLDRYRTRLVFAAALLLVAAALVAVTLAAQLWSVFAYALLFGVVNAFSMTLFGYLWPRYFGRRHLGSIQGTGQMIGVVGASLGPLPVGLAFDLFGNATITLWMLALFPLACALTALFLKTPAGLEVDDRLE